MPQNNNFFNMPVSAFTRIVHFLPDKEILTLRRVNKECWQQCRNLPGPHPNRYQFLAATSGHIKYPVSATNVFLASWLVYELTILRTRNHEPGFLYKMSDNASKEIMSEILNGESPEFNGRRYMPFMHCWPVNAAWVLAQIHKKRDMMLLSYFADFDGKRRFKNNEYSALTKELTCFVKMGYQLRFFAKHHDRTIWQLQPGTAGLQHLQTRYQDMFVTNSDCQQAMTTLSLLEKDRIAGARAAAQLKTYFTEICEPLKAALPSDDLTTLLDNILTPTSSPAFLYGFITQLNNYPYVLPKEVFIDDDKKELNLADPECLNHIKQHLLNTLTRIIQLQKEVNTMTPKP